MQRISEYEPKRVFHYFEEISKIPHGSYNTKEISDYLAGFAKDKGLKYVQDELGNVIIYVPASAGYEKAAPVILQGHMDMVCTVVPGKNIDMTKEALKLAIDGDWLYAENTTLGGDDGIAVAMMLALAESDAYAHPALEWETASPVVNFNARRTVKGELRLARGSWKRPFSITILSLW